MAFGIWRCVRSGLAYVSSWAQKDKSDYAIEFAQWTLKNQFKESKLAHHWTNGKALRTTAELFAEWHHSREMGSIN